MDLSYNGSSWKDLKKYYFSFTSILGFGVTFIQNFIFAALLDKEAFGRIFLISTMFSTFSYLSVFGLDTAIFKFYFDNRAINRQELKFGILITWGILSVGLMIILLLLGYVMINHFGFSLLRYDSEYLILVLSGVPFSFFLIFQQYYVASNQLLPYFMSSFVVRLTILIFNLASIYLFGDANSTFVGSYFIATTLLVTVGLISLRLFDKRNGINRDFISRIFSFSMPLIINGVISTSFTNGYRLLLSTLIPLGSIAIFGIISQISSAFYIGLSALILPFNSLAYQYLQEHKGSSNVPFYFAKCFLFGIVGVFCVLIVGYFLLKYFKGGLYFDGIEMLPILLAGQFIFVLYSHEHIVLSYWARTSTITVSTVVGIVVILTSVFPLVNWLDLWGACIAATLGYVAQYITAITFRKKLGGHA